jgi:hypothetical protein
VAWLGRRHESAIDRDGGFRGTVPGTSSPPDKRLCVRYSLARAGPPNKASATVSQNWLFRFEVQAAWFGVPTFGRFMGSNVHVAQKGYILTPQEVYKEDFFDQTEFAGRGQSRRRSFSSF